jgi:peptidylprolyl isomerase
VGDVWDVTTPDGSRLRARVVAKTDDTITLDANHPLAGHELVFDIRLEEIV